jgi:hypothetical protein
VIRVERFPEPPSFENLVRRPGLHFLAGHPHPTAREFSKHAYWRAIHGHLYDLYNGICSYCASWTPRARTARLDQTSIDHFIPKSAMPQMAYDWNNFRLCRSRLNANKGDSLDIIDPFFVVEEWFRLDFSSFLIFPSTVMPSYAQFPVNETIGRLGLNDNDYVNERLEVIKSYCIDNITFDDLSGKYPFIASQMLHHDFDNSYRPQMQLYFSSHP